MLKPDNTFIDKLLPGGLKLKTPANLDELKAVAAFNGSIHESEAESLTYNLFASHPDTNGLDLCFIEDDHHKVLSSLCLIPWTLRYGEVFLQAGELGIVGTREDQRGKGLNRILMEYFWQRFNERNCLLSIIQGIPYFYRQYGFEYSHIPLEGGWRIQADQIPDITVSGYRLREAGRKDLPELTKMFENQSRDLDISAVRRAEIWNYLLEDLHEQDAMKHDTLLVLSPDGTPSSYFRLPHFHFYPNLLTIDEISEANFEVCLVIFTELKRLAGLKGKEGIRLNLPKNSNLLQLSRDYGAAQLGSYSWQVRVPDVLALLRKIAPVLEERIARSMFAGFTRPIGLDIYREIIELEFINGRLKDVYSGSDLGNAILHIPPQQLIPLILGGKTIDQIGETFPDASPDRTWKPLVNTLFPKTNAFFHTIY